MNAAVVLVARSQARRRVRALIALTIFVGLAGGISISLIAGSRRSASVVQRYFSQARHWDAGVYPADSRAALLAIPGVARADSAAYIGMVVTRPDGTVIAGTNGNSVTWSAVDPTAHFVAGRIPDGSDPNEVVVNESFVKQFGLSVGDRIPVRMFGLDQGDDVSRGVYEPKGPRYTFRIAGVVRLPEEIATDEVRAIGHSSYGSTSAIFVSDRFYQAHRHEFLDFGGGYKVVLRDPQRDRAGFTRAVRALAPVGGDPPQVIPYENDGARPKLTTPVGLETTALLALGIGLAAASAIATLLVLRAEQRAHDDDAPTLRALGSTAPQLGGIAAIRALPVALGGTTLAVMVALLLSARYPIGIGRQLELDPGLQANIAVLVLGALAILLLVLGGAFGFGWARRRRDLPPSKVGRFADRLSRAGAPTDLTVAAHLSFDRNRTRSVPTRPAIVGGALLLAILTGVGGFVAGVDRVYGVPAARGWNWDAVIGNVNFPLAPATATKVANDPEIAHSTAAHWGHASVNGTVVEFVAFDPKGTAPPTVVSGRLPETRDELALGAHTLRDLGLHLGSTVRFTVRDGEFDTGGPSRTRTMRVVGTAIEPGFGDSNIAEGGIVPLAAVRAAGGDGSPQLEMVRLKGGLSDAKLVALDRRYTEEIANDVIPGRVVNLHRVRSLPLVGLALAALLALFVLVYALAITVRARMQDLAVLRAIGMPSRRIRRVLAWQGGLLGAGIAVLGFPVGLILGSAAWGRVTDDLGIPPGARLPLILFVVAPLTVLVAVAASVVPGRRASREQITALLRAE